MSCDRRVTEIRHRARPGDVDRGMSALTRRRRCALLAACLAASGGRPLEAQETPSSTTLPPVSVTASAVASAKTTLSPAADALPAETTTLGPKAIEREPIFSYGDIFRPLTGFDVSNYGQGGLGYGISLRGFTDAEHGRDIAYFIDGVPVNDVSSIHTPNYADLNILIPETVSRIDIIRGPFDPEFGDSNLGGVVNIKTKTDEPFSLGTLSGGSYATFRGVTTYSQVPQPDARQVPFLAVEGYSLGGYRNNSDYQRFNFFAKDTILLGQDEQLSARTQIYGGEWGAPGYISRDLVRAHLIEPTAAFNPTDGGNKYLEDLVLNYSRGAAAQGMTATVFAGHDNFTRYADFGRGQRGQLENRSTVGGRAKQVWTGAVLDWLPAQLSVGGDFRGDFVNVVQLPTVARNASGPATVNLHFDEYAAGMFAEIQIKPVDWFKLTGGSRYDQFFYDLRNRFNPLDSPNANPGIASPKLGAAISPFPWLEIDANYGQGFRSASAVSDILVNDRLGPLKLSSEEAGLRLTPLRGLSLLIDGWNTTISNEVFQPAPGLPPQNLGMSHRDGLDLEGRWDVLAFDDGTVSLFANLGLVEARLVDQGAARYVPNVPAYTANLGISGARDFGFYGQLSGSLYINFIGRKNLTEDGALKTSPYQWIAAKGAYNLTSGWSVFAEVKAYPSDRLSEFAVNFGPNTGATSADIFTSPVPALTILAGISYRFARGG
jgi:outer membrane receptor protein involved in Fe transport